jgi:uncharacterized iron-regulated protein
MKRRDLVILAGLAALLPGCAATGAGRAGLREADAFRQASFYDTGSGERVARRRLFRRMAGAQIVMLGEVHDNPVQHRIRGSLLLDWVRDDASRSAALVFEHLDREHDERLRLLQRRQGAGPSLEELLDAGGFDRKGWQWPAHQPLFEAAHASGATWIAANFSRASARGLSRAKDAEADPVLQAIVQSARWSEQAQRALDRALLQGHCGQLPQAALPGIARIQRLRDAALAQPLLDAADRRSMLLAGNGHVRRDHGVPLYLLALEREALVIGFEETADEPGQPGIPGEEVAATPLVAAVGAARAEDFGRAYDFVCLTPAAGRGDPCEGLPAISPAGPPQTPSR